MPEVYERLAIRYRQEPYRLKLAYILARLENTRDRNSQLAYGENKKWQNSDTYAKSFYRTGEEFLASCNDFGTI